VISTREFNQIKQALLFQFTNGGKPVIELVDSNFANRSELLLRHRHVGVDLRWDWAKEVLESLTLLWRRPVRLETIRKDKPTRLGHDGENPTEESVEEVAEAQTA
jgi:spore cortex formation protein SpoVR/YcgB (stage V sporulation)